MRTLYLLGDANASSVDFAQFWNTTDEVGGCFIFNLHAIESSDGNPTDEVGGWFIPNLQDNSFSVPVFL